MKITIDGKLYDIAQDKTLLEVCREVGLPIPTLCFDERLEPYGSCFLCTVEIEGMRGLKPACATKIFDGMIVKTQSPLVMETRRMCLELLLSNHYGDCLAPCRMTCPAGIDIQGYLAYTANGDYRKGIELIKQRIPFPGAIGRVCPRTCEDACRRNRVDDRVGIDYVKRFLADVDMASDHPYRPECQPDSGKRIAVIGGGPSGLTAAYFLRIKGHAVTVFEAMPKLGGMLRYGIPDYRLPQNVLDWEIQQILDLGVEAKTGVAFGKDVTLDSLKTQGFDAVYLAIGAWSSTKMRIENEKAFGVLSGIEFLRRVASGERPSIGDTIAVIGGGNTAIDAARSALRLGASHVMILYRRTEHEMPAHHVEIEEARLEGVDLRFLVAPLKILTGSDGTVTGVYCTKMELGEPDSSGRRRPVPVEGSEFTVPADTVIAAIGQAPDLSCLSSMKDVTCQVTKWGTVVADQLSLETSIPKVFAGGDVVNGAATAIEAMAHGRRVAFAIDAALLGIPIPTKVIDDRAVNVTKGAKLEDVDPKEFEGKPKIPKLTMPMMEIKDRISGFEEVELGFSPPMAYEEAKRCLSCGCLDVFECQLRRYSMDYDAKVEAFAGEIARSPIDDHSPYMVRDNGKCIVCGRCVRACLDLRNNGILGFLNRGFHVDVGPAPQSSLSVVECSICGECISVCPTGALLEKFTRPAPGPFAVEKIPSVCMHCGVGCEVDINRAGSVFVKVTPRHEDTSNQADTCTRGKFHLDFKSRSSRLTVPYIKRGSDLIPTSWTEAINRAAEMILQQKTSHGPESIAVLVGQQVTNEVGYTIQKLARAVIGTPNIGVLTEPGFASTDPKIIPRKLPPVATTKLDRFKQIYVLDSTIEAAFPPIARAIQKAAKGGSKGYLCSDYQGPLASAASASIRLSRAAQEHFPAFLIQGYLNLHKAQNAEDLAKLGNNAASIIAQWSKSPMSSKFATRKFDELLRNLECRDSNLFVINRSMAKPSTLQAVMWLSDLTCGTVLALDEASNAQGLRDMGVAPNYLPNYWSFDSQVDVATLMKTWESDAPLSIGSMPEEMVKKIREGAIGLVLAFGTDEIKERVEPYLANAKRSIIGAMSLNEYACKADVALPMVSYAEESGTITSSDGSIRTFRQAFPPVSGFTNLQIITALVQRLSRKQWPADPETVLKEILSSDRNRT